MAAAVVSGSVATLLAADPSLNPATIKARLMRSARKVAGDPVAMGAGVLNLKAALTDHSVIKGEALSPLLAQKAAR